MANRLKIWGTEILTSSDLNAEFDNIYSGSTTKTAGSFGLNDDVPLLFGTSSNARLEWDTGQSSDALVLGLSGSRTLIICELADMATDFQVPIKTDPTLIIHSSNAATLSDYLEFRHNQTGGVINVGGGGLLLQLGGSTKLQIDSSSVFAFGGAAANKDNQFRFGGSYTTSETGTTSGAKFLIDGTLTGNVGKTSILAGARINPTITTQGASETIASVSSLYVNPPIINIGTGDSVTVAASIAVVGAPSVGTYKYTLYVTSSAEARIDGTLNIGNTTGGTSGSKVFIKTSDTSTKGLICNTVSGSTVSLQEWQYNSVLSAQLDAKAGSSNFTLLSRDLGNDIAGPYVSIGRNSNTTNPNAGTLRLTNVSGTSWNLWVDTSGILRLHTSPPGGAVSDTAGSFIPKISASLTTNSIIYAVDSNTVAGAAGVKKVGGVGFVQSDTSNGFTFYNENSNAVAYIGSGYFNGLKTQEYGTLHLPSLDTGPDTPGPSILIGRNSNATTPRAGSLGFTAQNGLIYYLWVDSSGKLRIAASNPPGDGAPDTYGVVVGTQT